MARSIKTTSASSQPKAFDVIAPGKSAPSASNRPIIVTNRPMIKDPMAPPSLEMPLPAGDTSVPLVPAVGSTLLEPSDEPNHPSRPMREGTHVSVTPIKEIQSSPSDSIVSQASLEDTDAAAVPIDSISDAKEAFHISEPQEKPQLDAAAEKIADAKVLQAANIAQEKIALSKQYYLPIRLTDKRRDAHRVLLVLVLVAAISVIWFDLLLDAGIVHIQGIQSLTHFFSSRA